MLRNGESVDGNAECSQRNAEYSEGNGEYSGEMRSEFKEMQSECKEMRSLCREIRNNPKVIHSLIHKIVFHFQSIRTFLNAIQSDLILIQSIPDLLDSILVVI